MTATLLPQDAPALTSAGPSSASASPSPSPAPSEKDVDVDSEAAAIDAAIAQSDESGADASHQNGQHPPNGDANHSDHAAADAPSAMNESTLDDLQPLSPTPSDGDYEPAAATDRTAVIPAAAPTSGSKGRKRAAPAPKPAPVDPSVARATGAKLLDELLGKAAAYMSRTAVGAELAPHTSTGRKSKSKGKGRMSEKEEDDVMLNSLAKEAENAPVSYPPLTEQPANITGKMRAYQVEGLNWMIRLYDSGVSGILADEMGLGKTLQSISLIAYLKGVRGVRGPHLVLTPLSTLGNWHREFARWCPELRVCKFHGTREERLEMIARGDLGMETYDVLLTSYEMAIREKSHINRINWCFIVVDEAHRLKNENSLLSVIVRYFSSRYRLLLTGTPLQNNLHELWALLNFLLPDLFSSSGEFDAIFQDAETDSDSDRGATLLQSLHRLLRPFMLRRMKQQVETDLPPKKTSLIYTGLSDIQRKLYKQILEKDVEALMGTIKERSRLMNMVMQLRKVADHPFLFDGVEEVGAPLHGEHLIQVSGKMRVMDKLLAHLQQRGSRVLIFSQMTRMLDILEDYMITRRYQYCFPASDTRVLTNQGFLFLDEIQERLRRGEPLRYACYDEKSTELQYSEGVLVIPEEQPSHLVQFTSSGEGVQWNERSGAYGMQKTAEFDDEDEDDDDAPRSRHVSLRVTPDHRMYVQTGNMQPDGKKMHWHSTVEGGRKAVNPYFRVPASDLSSQLADDRDWLRMLAFAGAGYVPQYSARRAAVMQQLGLTTDAQFLAFMELFGFWLGHGTLNPKDRSVMFGQVAHDDRNWLRLMMAEVGLVKSKRRQPKHPWSAWSCAQLSPGYSIRHSGAQEWLSINLPGWFDFFDSEFGVKYKHSRFFDRRLALRKQGVLPGVSAAAFSSLSASASVSVPVASSSSSSSSGNCGGSNLVDDCQPVAPRSRLWSASTDVGTPRSTQLSTSARRVSFSFSSNSGQEAAMCMVCGGGDDSDERSPMLPEGDGYCSTCRAPMKPDSDSEVVMVDEDEEKRDSTEEDEIDEEVDEDDMDVVDLTGEDAPPDCAVPRELLRPLKCVKWLPEWMLAELTPAEMQKFVSGLHRADGHFAQGKKCIHTSGVLFRDQLVHAFLHCGYSAYATCRYRAGAITGYYKGQDILGVQQFADWDDSEEKLEWRPCRATADGWSVHWTDMGHLLNHAGQGSCRPTLSRQKGIEAVPYSREKDGPVWCVSIAHKDSLIIAQRAERHNGIVTKQSRPIVVSNCRIDGNTPQADREEHMRVFNEEGSPKFCFLLSTRAGGLGINLVTADTVILYDSDWNPQMDLQAMDRAHRIGQKKPVNVLRLVCEDTVEVQMLKRAEIKLHLDAMVIQQGKVQAGDKGKAGKGGMTTEDLTKMIRYGADKIFRQTESTINDEDIANILEKGEQHAKEMDSSLKQHVTLHALQLDGQVEDNLLPADPGTELNLTPEELEIHRVSMVAEALGKRNRKQNYNEDEYYREVLKVGGRPVRTLLHKPFRVPRMSEHQFYDRKRIEELSDKEVKFYHRYYHSLQPPSLRGLSEAEVAEMESLLEAGYEEWSFVDYQKFLKALRRYGRHQMDKIAEAMAGRGKTREQVETYHGAFFARVNEMKGGPALLARIERAEKRQAKFAEMEELLDKLLSNTSSSSSSTERNATLQSLPLRYSTVLKERGYTEAEDRYLLWLCREVGFGEWSRMGRRMERDEQFNTDWYLVARSPVELERRVTTLLKEIQRQRQPDGGRRGGKADKKDGTAGGEAKAEGKAEGKAVGAEGKAGKQKRKVESEGESGSKPRKHSKKR